MFLSGCAKEISFFETGEAVEINFNGAKLFITADENDYYLPKVSSLTPNYIEVDAPKNIEVYINGQLFGEETSELLINEISNDSKIEIEMKDTKTNTSITKEVQTYPSWAPKFIVENMDEENIIDGYFYFTIDKWLLKVDANGRIVFSWFLNEYVLNFNRFEIDNKVFYSYNQKNYDKGNVLSGVGYVPSMNVVLDENWRIIDIVELMKNSETIKYDTPLDSHEFIVLGENHYLMLGYYGETVFNIPSDIDHSEFGVRVCANVIQEVKNGELVWEWNSTNYPELYGMTLKPFADYYNLNYQWDDYIHMNSIDVDNDGNYILSMRSLSSIVKIDSTSGEILWILGGKGDQFNLTNHQKLSMQHYARRTKDGSITVFDNGTDLKAIEDETFSYGQTRIAEYYLDEEQKKLISFNEYKIDQQYSQIMGNADKLSQDIFVIGWGGRTTQSPLLSVIDFKNKKPIFNIVYPKITFESDTYRALFYKE